MGAHYTGAVMGMPHASGAIRIRPALALMASLTILGATFGSGEVQKTVGLRIVDASSISVAAATVMVLSAAILTTVYTYLRIPSSTIQIFVFSIVGAGVAAHTTINWATILHLALLWAVAPIAAFLLGFLLTRCFDLLVRPLDAETETRRVAEIEGSAAPLPAVVRALPGTLIAVGCLASLALGANDVSNAVAVFTMVHLTSTTVAGLLGGIAMAVGAVSWGRRILKRVAFDVVKIDLAMATAAQLVQACVILAAVGFGLFTSMNQALIGAMTGAGLARGNETIRWSVVRGILSGWAIGPVSGAATGFLLHSLIMLFGVH